MNTINPNSDKKIEKKRYELKALSIIKNHQFKSPKLGSEAINLFLRTPYVTYEKALKDFIKPQHKVLEIGSGFGRHTYSLLETNANVTATDISGESLKVLELLFSRFVKNKSLSIKIADMECLPFEDETFDVVTCAGSLSYGNSEIVDNQIHRVLKSNGRFICIDSLNNNLIYRLNRFTQFLCGSRTKMTIKNMPNMKRLQSIKKRYNEVEIKYFGSISYLMPIVSSIYGDHYASNLSNYIDKIINVRNSAFKFVLSAKV